MSERIRGMFDRIAPRYELVNTFLGLGMMPGWRRLAVSRSGVLPGQAVLDCASGTGQLAIEFARRVGPAGRVVALDFSAEMLSQVPSKARRAGLGNIETMQADMLALPFPAASFDCASCSFGIRNTDDPRRALAEMARVVHPGGSVAILETGQPANSLWRWVYGLYNRVIFPWVGGLVTGQWAAYRHLRDTVRTFPSGAEFEALLREAHPFAQVQRWPLLGGVVWIYVGRV
jgi:demethylmenaquinone methyltransferase/2-methoxy-6-polyprenyl-1,4-benzoquinol methylase